MKILSDLTIKLLEAQKKESKSGLIYLNDKTHQNELNYKLDQGHVNGLLEAIEIVKKPEVNKNLELAREAAKQWKGEL